MTEKIRSQTPFALNYKAQKILSVLFKLSKYAENLNLIIVCSVNKIHNISEKIRSEISQNEPESVIVFLVNFMNIWNCGTNDRDNDWCNTCFGTNIQNFRILSITG